MANSISQKKMFIKNCKWLNKLHLNKEMLIKLAFI